MDVVSDYHDAMEHVEDVIADRSDEENDEEGGEDDGEEDGEEDGEDDGEDDGDEDGEEDGEEDEAEGYPKYLHDLPYGGPPSTYLHKLGICFPRPLSSSPPHGLWIIFVHGGDWREPSIDRKLFHETQEILLSDQSVLAKIVAFVSLDYYLSPFPSDETNPSSHNDPARNTHHPANMQDIGRALQYLQETYCMQDRYILTGHSTGASIIYQGLISTWRPGVQSPIPTLDVLRVSGIYDLSPYITDPQDRQSIINNVFGHDVGLWEAASLDAGQKEWTNPLLAMRVYSGDDQEVDEGQPQTILHVVEGLEDPTGEYGDDGRQRRNRLLMLTGQHNELWKEGTELARAIEEAVDMVSSSS